MQGAGDYGLTARTRLSQMREWQEGLGQGSDKNLTDVFHKGSKESRQSRGVCRR